MDLIAHDVALLLKHIKMKTRVSRHKGEGRYIDKHRRSLSFIKFKHNTYDHI